MIKLLRIVAPFFILAGLIYGFGQRHGPIPALTKFLHPFHGVWVPADDDLKRLESVAKIPGLKAPVQVKFDENRIPHVFAQNDEDAFAVQGYLVAMDRMFQMEFMVRAGLGRLSEVLGRRTVDLDIMFNRLELREAAQESFELIQRDDLTRLAVEAYARGVNAYIANVHDRDLPFEYKLLEHKPMKWEPMYSAVISKVMSYNLSFWPQDLLLTRSRSRISEDDFQALFPVRPDVDEPIVPNETKWNFQSAVPTPPPAEFQASTNAILPVPTPHEGNGSNNWAVGPKKSSTGFPIVSNDIHLSLQLPSYWYELQLASPNFNVYGGTLPGAPGVVLGFNQKLSWAVTNGMNDIADWFELKYRDANKYEYMYDGTWRPVIARDREIQIRGEKPLVITLRRTHFGPIINNENETPVNPLIPRGLALRWGALIPSNELKTFLSLNRAQSFKECRQAIDGYQNPSQNFLCADRNDYGIVHQGQFPVRWPGQGRLISDGTNPLYDWDYGFVSSEELPKLINPARGYVLSANQPAAGKDYPHFLPGMYDNSFRARRIAELLRAKEKFSPDEFVKMQSDSFLVVARDVVPVLLAQLPENENWSRLERSAIEELKKWDFFAESDRSGAVIYDKWISLFVDETWNDHFPNAKHYYYPRTQQTAKLIVNDPSSKWFDRIETDEVETLQVIAIRTFKKSISALEEKLGGRAEAWEWGEYQPATFEHFAKIPGLQGKPRKTRGHAHAIFANRAIHGPVWKTVVAVGPKMKAWGVYPGGQSGNPISRHYDSFLDLWAKGELKPLEYLTSSSDQLSRELKSVEFKAEASK